MSYTVPDSDMDPPVSNSTTGNQSSLFDKLDPRLRAAIDQAIVNREPPSYRGVFQQFHRPNSGSGRPPPAALRLSVSPSLRLSVALFPPRAYAPSAMSASERITLSTLRARKRAKQKIVVLTAYDHPTAVIEQQAGVDAILVGDSVAQVLLGHGSTLPATMDLLVTLTAAVRRGAPNVYLIGDMPFLSYHVTIPEAVRNAGRFMVEAECDAVKIECDREYRDTVAALTRAGIPVITHLGLRPQTVHQIGGYRSQARDAESAQRLAEDARILEEAGAVALLLEAVPPEPARMIAESTALPVIGCGAGPFCDGHVIVLQDMLGLSPGPLARFVPKYADLRTLIGDAVRRYVSDVRSGAYPAAEHCYQMESGQADALSRLAATRAGSASRTE